MESATRLSSLVVGKSKFLPYSIVASELELQAKHHFAAVTRGSGLAEGIVGLRAGGAPLSRRADGAELGVIEAVECLPPELQRLPLGDLEGLEE